MQFGEPFKPGEEHAAAGHVVTIWNLLGGELNWQGLGVALEMIGSEDADLTIRQLVRLRERLAQEGAAR